MSREILAGELIGLRVKVEGGPSGRVIDETMNMLVIETERGVRRFPKRGNFFIFSYEGKKVRVDGRMLVARPEDRIKKALHLSRKWRLPGFFFKS